MSESKDRIWDSWPPDAHKTIQEALERREAGEKISAADVVDLLEFFDIQTTRKTIDNYSRDVLGRSSWARPKPGFVKSKSPKGEWLSLLQRDNYITAVDPEISKWATPRQKEAIESLLRLGSFEEAAEELGITPKSLRNCLSEAKRRAARAGWSPGHDMERTVPDGYHVRGVSSYYDKDGALKGQWVKSQKDPDHKIAYLLDAMQEIAEPFRGKSELSEPPDYVENDLFTVYPMGDPHIGMFSWPEETGEAFDLEIAESTLVNAVDHLVGLSPPTSSALIANLGDFFHTDTKDNVTRMSKNPLDVDTRWSKVLSVGIRIMRRCIDKALEKHEIVNVVNEIGNHDDHTSIMLSLCLDQYYENNPRVKIDTSPSHFHYFRFGEVLVGITHGNNTKMRDLPGIMASDRKRDWGETEHRYWYTGHVHHDQLKEFPGCIVESFRTLASKDAWHAMKGYRSGRDMKCDVIHSKYGRINRHTVGIQQVW